MESQSQTQLSNRACTYLHIHLKVSGLEHLEEVGLGGQEEVFVILTSPRCKVESIATEKPVVAGKAMHTYPASWS